MKIKMSDVIRLSAVLLQLESVLALLSEAAENMSEEDILRAEAEKKLLLRCANLVVSEVAAEYLPLKTVETLSSVDGRIEYSSFSKQPVEVCGVRKKGEKCRYKMYPSKIITDAGEVEVCYSYLPRSIGIEEDLDFEEGRISPRILAYGTAAEYCIISGLHQEAGVWDKRYKDSLFGALRTGRSVRLPLRWWA